MNTPATKLIKATTIVQRIQELDARIITLEKAARKVAEGEQITASLQLLSQVKKSESERTYQPFSTMSFLYGYGAESSPKSDPLFESDLSDIEQLVVLDALIRVSMDMRKTCIQQLNEMGLTL